MSLYRYSTLVLLAAASGLASLDPAAHRWFGPSLLHPQALACEDPTPDQPLWWAWTWTPNPDGSKTGTAPEPPPLQRDLHLARWAGRYRLLVIATGGTLHRDTVAATLSLRSASGATRGSVALVGYVDSAIVWPVYFTFAHSPALQGPPRYGAEVLYDRDRGAITLILGNGGLYTTDSGVIFDVFSIDSTGLVGRWVDGGLGVLVDSAGHELGHPQGYFCLERLAP